MENFYFIAIGCLVGYLIFLSIGYYFGKHYERKAWNKLIDAGKLPTPYQSGFIINPLDKLFPDSESGMWEYCTYLGKYVDKHGAKWDLGILIQEDGICDASVYGNEESNYTSGRLYYDDNGEYIADHVAEVTRRAKQLNLITEEHKRNIKKHEL